MGKVENATTKAVETYLTAIGAFVWRTNTRVVDMPGKGGKTFPMRFGYPGCADVIGVLPGGRFIGVEVKRPLGPKGGHGGSKQSDDQVKFQADVERCGGLYILARSIDDVADVVK